MSPAHAEHVLRELRGHEDKACVRQTRPQTFFWELILQLTLMRPLSHMANDSQCYGVSHPPLSWEIDATQMGGEGW